MADLAYTQIFEVVEAYHKGEGARPNRELYFHLLNKCLDKITLVTGGYDTSWTNDGGTGSPTLSNGDVTFPPAVVSTYEKGVLWNDARLLQTSIAKLDSATNNWRESTGTPSCYARTERGMVLYPYSTGTTTSLLVIWGRTSIPHLTDATGGIGYLPEYLQYGIADYIIGRLPMDYRDKSEETIATMREARRDARREWREHLKQIAWDVTKKRLPSLGAEVV